MHMFKNHSTRRQFLIQSAGLALAAAVPSCTQPPKKNGQPVPGPEITAVTEHELSASGSWIARGEHQNAYAVYRKTVEAATDFSWLSKGDRVLLKVAMNSGNRYPATTDPWSVACMVRLLKEKGAGKIMVGDQGGFGAVQWTKDRQIGSSRQLAKNTGLLKAIEENQAEPCFFEEFGWDAYQEAYPAGDHHWRKPILVPAMLDEVDHIIYLPRVSSHILAGSSLGFKLAVGFLRSDSRGEFHRGGEHFYAMYEEINHIPQIASKLRLTVSSGRSVLTLIGPNDGPTAKPDHGLLLASEDLLAHEMLAYAWLQWNREFETSAFSHMTSGKPTKSRSGYNKRFTDRMWPDKNGTGTPPIAYFKPGNLYNHPAVINCLLRRGGRPKHIFIKEINRQPNDSAAEYMRRQINHHT